jgi:hypothetical protein
MYARRSQAVGFATFFANAKFIDFFDGASPLTYNKFPFFCWHPKNIQRSGKLQSLQHSPCLSHRAVSTNLRMYDPQSSRETSDDQNHGIDALQRIYGVGR